MASRSSPHRPRDRPGTPTRFWHRSSVTNPAARRACRPSATRSGRPPTRDSDRSGRVARLLAGRLSRQRVRCAQPAAVRRSGRLSGALIGAQLDDEYPGDLEGTPIFLGCSDDDPHIPEARVHDTAAVFEAMNADVTARLYEGMGHGINEDELAAVADLVAALVD